MASPVSTVNSNTVFSPPAISNHNSLDLIETSPDFNVFPRAGSPLFDMHDYGSSDHLAHIDFQETALQAQTRIERNLFSDFEGGLYGALANLYGEYKMPESWNAKLELHYPENKIIPVQNRNQDVEMADSNESIQPEASVTQQTYSDEGLNVLKALETRPASSAKKFNAAQHNPFDSNDRFTFENAHEIAVFRLALANREFGASKITDILKENGIELNKSNVSETMSKYELTLYDMVKVNRSKTKRVEKIDQRPLLNDKYQDILTQNPNNEDLLQKIKNNEFTDKTQSVTLKEATPQPDVEMQ